LSGRLKDIADSFAGAGLRGGARDQLIRGDVQLFYGDAGKSFFEDRQNLLGIDLRQGAVKIHRTFRCCFLVELVDTLGMGLGTSEQRRNEQKTVREGGLFFSKRCHHHPRSPP